MVTEFGMSDAVGAINFSGQKRGRFIDAGMPVERGPYAEQTAELIDAEVKRIITDSHELARRLLTEHRGHLESVTRRLLDKEVMEGAELREILAEPQPA
jgi:cell division protease FtsH